MFTNSKSPLIQIYALAICFVTVLCLVITIGVALYDVFQIAFPNITYNSGFVGLPQVPKPGTPEYQEAMQEERLGAIRSIVQATLIIVIDVVLLIIHWRLAKKMTIYDAAKPQPVIDKQP